MKSFTVCVALLATLCLTEAAFLRQKRSVRGGTTGADELKFDANEKKAFDELKAAATKEDVGNPALHSDIYLAKFLRANKGIAFAAIEMYKKTIAWRKENKIEAHGGQDNSDGFKKLEICTNQTDVDGRVVLYLQVGKWAIAGIKEKESALYERTWYQAFEESANKALDNYSNGMSKYAQYDFVLNYDKWTTAQGGCVECSVLVGKISGNYGIYYPGLANRIVLYNTAEDFKLFLNIIRPFLTAEVNDKLEVFGRSKTEFCGPIMKLMPHHSEILKDCLKL